MRKNLASLLTRDQITAALEHIIKNNISLHESTGFDLNYNGKKFPPKEVVREAARLAGMDPSQYRLNGGPPTNDPLQKLGFTIQPKNASMSAGPRELVDALVSYMDNATPGEQFGKYRYTGKNTLLAFGTPGGRHEPDRDPGYIFSYESDMLLLRFLKSTLYIAVENVRRETQLANLRLVPNKTYISENGSTQLRENYRITVRSAQPYQTSRSAMLRSGFSEDNVIVSYEDPVTDAKEIIDGLLEWAEIRQEAKDLIKSERKNQIQDPRNEPMSYGIALNTILYGPPGTGKTYHTIDRALAITDPVFYEKFKYDRDKLIERFNELLIEDWSDPKGKIAFVTFHQSMSYEDFIEGIKPDIIEGDDAEKENITYDIKDGIFKLIAEKASWKKGNFDEVFEDFKSSIDQANGNQPVTIKAKYTTFDVVYRGTTVLYVNPKSSKKDDAWYPVSIVNIRKVYETANYKGIYNPTYVREILQYLKQKKGLREPSDVPNPEPHVIIIDEISRGNVAQIFGELITLLEEDKRENGREALKVILPYSKQPFSVPDNLYVIGTMNTADRSVEALDTALGRRFSFEELPPQPELLAPERMLWKFWWDNREYAWGDDEYVQAETPFYELLGFPPGKNNLTEKDRYWDPLWEQRVPDESQIASLKPLTASFTGIDLYRLLTRINQRLQRLLNKDRLIGHAYFINVGSVLDLKMTIFNKVIPLLQEHFYGDYGRIGLVIGKAFINIEKRGQVPFMKIDGYQAGDFNENDLYHLRKMEDFRDDKTFIDAIKAIYE